MKRKTIIIILCILFVISLFFSIVSILEHNKNKNIKIDDYLYALEYKKTLIDNLNDYIDNNNIDLKNSSTINVYNVLDRNICSGLINFNSKKDVIINDINLTCDYKLDIKSITYNSTETIIDLVKLEKGYFLITYDEKELNNYVIKLDENFETEWKNKIDYSLDVNSVKYLGYHFEKSNNKYYIILDVVEKGYTYNKDHTIIASVDKNGYNFEVNIIRDLTIEDIYKIEVNKDTIFIYDTNNFVVGYDLKNNKTTKIIFGQDLDYNHEKLIGIKGGYYYTYEQVYKVLYKYIEPTDIYKELDLYKDTKEYTYPTFDEFKPFIYEDNIYVRADKNDYSSILVYDLDFNYKKEISLKDIEYNSNNLLNDKTSNIILYLSIKDKYLYITSRVEYDNKKFITFNVYDIEKETFKDNKIIDLDSEIKLLNNKGNEIMYYVSNKYDKRSIINIMKYKE